MLEPMAEPQFKRPAWHRPAELHGPITSCSWCPMPDGPATVIVEYTQDIPVDDLDIPDYVTDDEVYDFVIGHVYTVTMVCCKEHRQLTRQFAQTRTDDLSSVRVYRIGEGTWTERAHAMRRLLPA